VEVSSEQHEHPIEAVFAEDCNRAWRAGQPSEQMIRLLFDHPVALNRIQLGFDEQG
jgi:hypothetical protein